MVTHEHHLIIVPGLSGGSTLFDILVHSWKRYSLIPHVHTIDWHRGDFTSKLNGLTKQIDLLYKEGGKISLVGTSAGGSAVLNAFSLRKPKIHKVINICGRIRKGYHVHPTLEKASQKSHVFKTSVLIAEDNERNLTEKDRRKILTIRPLFDEVVPRVTIPIEGANNMQIFSLGHMLSIGAALTIYSNLLTNFLKQD